MNDRNSAKSPGGVPTYSFSWGSAGVLTLKESDPHITELAMVLLGLKPVLYTNFFESEWPYLEELCRKFQLKFLIPDRTPFTPASNNGRKTALIGQNPKVLKKAADQWNLNSLSREWGIFLGYPTCCVDFYLKYPEVQDASVRPDLAHRIMSNTSDKVPVSYLLNNVFNYFSRAPGEDAKKLQELSFLNRRLNLSSLHIIPWHPCSYACKPSLEIGRKIEDFLLQNVPRLAAKIRLCLRRQILHLGKFEFVVLDGQRVSAREMTYTNIVPPFSLVSEKFTSAIARGNRLKVGDGTLDVFNAADRVASLEAPYPVILDFKSPDHGASR